MKRDEDCDCTGGLIGDTLSTGGKGAHGDLDGTGAGLLDVRVGFSFGPLDAARAFLACLSALAPSLRTVAFGPTEVVDFVVNVLVVVSIAEGGSNVGIASFVSFEDFWP
jgi:hypothetical protein